MKEVLELNSTQELLKDFGLYDKSRQVRLYIEALTPPRNGNENNRKLEVLGDAVLLTVTLDLLTQEKATDLKAVSEVRASIVSNRALARTAEKVGLAPYIRVSELPPSPSKAYTNMVASALEAFIGAVYRDQGFETCKQFIIAHLWEVMKKQFKRPKEGMRQKLEKHLSAKGMKAPAFNTYTRDGGIYGCKVYTGHIFLAQAEGTSKKEAEQIACSRAIKSDKEHRKKRQRRRKRR